MKDFTIFYTDDDDDDLSIFADAVESVPQKVSLQTYTGGEKLLQAIFNPPPTPYVVFLDLNMPGKNGFEVLQEIRGSDKKNIPVIIYSTSNEPSIIERCRNLGASCFVTKPILMSDIIKSIQHALEVDWEKFTPTHANFVYKY
ncbi:response regulator [Flavobacterium hungaricum]|uniref:Response regulator n=1 Tax=Flavobacterium hungaricum TaxID=2082725 RepID=A0ABR9TFY1_9FLAO|nr:response regulator [Flavobacterium hungaricum]MBE8724263.1 response regulator [Flavobacterium hungaricum]